MLELRFAITQPEQKSVSTGSIYGQLTQVLPTLAALAEESHGPSIRSTFLWMDDKASSSCLKTGLGPGMPHSIDNTTHTPVLRSQVYIPTVFLIQ